MVKFETGKTYSTRSLCDYECIFEFEVIKRTNKRITLKYLANNSIKTVGIYEYKDHECADPFGKYSMNPSIEA